MAVEHRSKAGQEHRAAGRRGQPFGPESATTYRALAARCNYASQDRPDAAFASKELCRDSAAPTGDPMKMLMRRIRYLNGKPRRVFKFPWQSRPEHLSIDADTDVAGCQVTRMSTSGGVAMHGSHCIRHWSSTQPTIALSSGEAELGGLSKGCAQGIGLRSIATDLGFEFKVTLLTDATAAMGMARRRGVGKIRHLDAALMWIQQKVRSGDVGLCKVSGTEQSSRSADKASQWS